jgi:hypothetical protein
MPCHHNLDEYLHAYMNAALLPEAKSILFPTTLGRTGQLSNRPMSQADAYRMIRGKPLRLAFSQALLPKSETYQAW